MKNETLYKIQVASIVAMAIAAVAIAVMHALVLFELNEFLPDLLRVLKEIARSR